MLTLANTQENDAVGIYAGASGVGTAAIQLVKNVFKARSFTIAGNDEKCEFIKGYIKKLTGQTKLHLVIRLGATHVYNYKTTKDLAERIMADNSKKGLNALLDCLGPAYFEQVLLQPYRATN
mgnify:CR=1 FL=1